MEAVASDSRTLVTSELDRLVGTRTANALAKLDLHTVADLLAHVPRRLTFRGSLMPLSSITEGEAVTVVARVMSSTLRPMNARRGYLLSVRISDSRQDMELTFFGKSRRPLAYHEGRLAPGTLATFSGVVSTYRGKLQLTHPEYEVVETEESVDRDKIERPIPIYPAAMKVPTWKIASALDTVLDMVSPADIPEVLPEQYRKLHDLPGAYEALVAVHRPVDEDSWRKAKRRLAHEEAFVLQTVLGLRRHRQQASASVPRPARLGGLRDALDARLPFHLTEGQRSVGARIEADLAGRVPMNRLLQGDVGSGKTVVALRAMAQVIDAGGQAALLAPTEVLAAQHYRTIVTMLGDHAHGGQLGAPDVATRVDLLTGSMPASAKKEVLFRLASGQTGIVVGTHALLSDTVAIPDLSLAVVDEQHRFGVDQRDRLRGRGGVSLLVMTATPIPRTLAMTVFGDLDVSELVEVPAGRAEITTTIVPTDKRSWVNRVWQRAAEEVADGGRVFVVCPRITADSDDDLPLGDADGQEKPLTTVEETVAELEDHPALTNLSIGRLVGPMPAEEKDKAMERFANGDTPILVATTVIEVGIDVPEATMMIIMDADRFGLSQLHQLRGRIGRGTRPGLCLALTGADPDSLAGKRLAAFASTRNGFTLAEADLELRREGDVLGANQSGSRSGLRHLSILTHRDIVEAAHRGARDLIKEDPDLSGHPVLADRVASIEAGTQSDYLEKN